MKKRRWLRWVILVLALALIGVGIWVKAVIDKQPKTVPDPGVPEVLDLPDPDEVE